MFRPGSHVPQPVWQSEGKGEGGSFTDPVFDDEYYGRDKSDGKGRTIGLAIGVVVGAVIAGFAAWTVFAPGSGRNTTDAPLIVPQPEPYKVRPDDPGGMEVANQDKLVYERVGGDAPTPGAENILPPPEAPRAPAVAEPAPEITEPAPEITEPAPEITQPAPAAPLAAEAPPAVRAAEQIPEVSESAAVPEPAPASDTSPEPAPVAAVSELAAAPTVEAQPRPTPQDPLEAAVAAVTGDYLIQIAALRSEEAADDEWQRVLSRHTDILGGLNPVIVTADLGERGIFYRLRAGPLADRSAAEEVCGRLAAESVGCLVVRNE
jgi:cell division septation protein DedD